jgi:hypothetical protein
VLTIILLCNVAIADCSAINAEATFHYKTEAVTPMGCLKEVNEYIAKSPLVEKMDRVKIICGGVRI